MEQVILKSTSKTVLVKDLTDAAKCRNLEILRGIDLEEALRMTASPPLSCPWLKPRESAEVNSPYQWYSCVPRVTGTPVLFSTILANSSGET